MNKLLETESFHLTNKSGNFKTGKMAVSTSSRKTCDATSCPFHEKNKGGCYAHESYHLRMHWDKVTSGERGFKWDLFLNQLKKLKKGSELRINQAGDIVLDDLNNISQKYLNGIIESTKHLLVFNHLFDDSEFEYKVIVTCSSHRAQLQILVSLLLF